MLQYSMYIVYIYLSFIRDLLKLNKVLYQMSASLFYEDRSQWKWYYVLFEGAIFLHLSIKSPCFLWWLLLPMQNFVK